jgi:hypothetical protein
LDQCHPIWLEKEIHLALPLLHLVLPWQSSLAFHARGLLFVDDDAMPNSKNVTRILRAFKNRRGFIFGKRGRR